MTHRPLGERFADFLRIDAPGNERGTLGSLSPAVAILAVMIFTLAGLVIDGGRQLGARSRAVGYAQEAARVGAATIQLNSDVAKIDVAKAGTAIAAFCNQIKANDPAVTECGPTTLDEKTVDIRVVITNPTTFLGMLGKPSLKAPGTGQAHAEQGVKKPDEKITIPPIVVNSSPDGPGNITTGTAAPPTLDLPCPTWTIGSPTPTWTLSPFPFPRTCTPSITPSPDPSAPSTSPSPTDTETSEEPGGGAPAGATLRPGSGR